MPRETKPSFVYLVKGEGVRNRSWVLQEPLARPEYSNPPVEQIDSVPTPFGPDLSIRIFSKGTKPVPDFFSSNPATDVVAAEAEPMVPPSTQTPRTLPQPSPDPSPPPRPSAPSIPPKPSTIPPTPSTNPTPTSASVLPKPRNAAPRTPSRFSVDQRGLRNFRNLRVRIIADPKSMPPPYFLSDPSTSSQPTQAQPKPLQPSAKNASEQSVRKTSEPTPSTLPRSTVMASQERSRTSPVLSAHMKTAQPPSLALPGPASPPRASQEQKVGITSPLSAFGRWKTSSPLPPPGQKSPQLPSPPKAKLAVADKSRQKPWQKTKSGKPVSTVTAGHEKALQDIVQKTMKGLPRHSKTLPPLTSLTSPASRPSKPAVVRTKALTSAMVPDPVSEEPSSPRIIQAAGQPAIQSTVVKDLVPQASRQPPREPLKRPTTADEIHVRKEDGTKARPKAPGADSTSLGKTPSTKNTPSVPDHSVSRLPPGRKLLQKAPAESDKVTTLSTSSSLRPSPKPHDHSAKHQTGVIEKSPVSTKTAIRRVSQEPSAEIAPSPSPRISTDEMEVGTAARPIITREDQLKARQTLGKQKGRFQEKPAQPQSPSSNDRSVQNVVGSKGKDDQRSGSELELASKSDAIRQAPSRDTASLFDSGIQESMKSVIEQVVWTVQHFERKFGISNQNEMRHSKRKLLNFIHVHLDDLRSGSDQSGLAKRQSVQAEHEEHVSRTVQIPSNETEAARGLSDSRQTDAKTVKAHRMFVAWKRDLQTGNRPLKAIATEAKELRQAVVQCDMKVIHFSSNDLIIRLKELSDLSFAFLELEKKLVDAKSEIQALKATENLEETEFGRTFGIIKCAVLWMSFLAEQVTQTWKSLMEASKARALGFAREVFKVLIKESHQTGASEASDENIGVIKRVRRLKSLIGKFEGALGMANNGKSVSLTIQELLRKFADICKFGKEEKRETPSSPTISESDRGTPGTGRPDSTFRRSPAVKPNESQQPRHPSRETSAPGTSSGINMPRGLVEAQHEKSTATGTSLSSKSSPAIPIPRRPSEPVSPSQTGLNSRRFTTSSASAPRRPNTNLLSLMVSARTVHEPRQTGSTMLGNKRKADEDSDRNSSESDGKPAKKRRVRFAPTLVQGAQSTPYTKEALSSLFFDGYDLLGNTTSLQRDAVEERASQMSRGSVIATFGFLRSYIGALKAARDGHNCERPEWVRLPYTAAMKKDIYRHRERLNDSRVPHPP